ncbi:apolipoprotein N-acyltransferase [Parafilimonas terrae]|uniref:Apolipoprotein N-acyltransferase n=1 Tax=Parafilimonas terrae TaxID=1465490 RepID=A0A1I5YBY9_9BACT|nr:apolipoprotein N-acyltransferase [Parafilimonas terrae]SFQ41741.1 Apolipoprotein N-acyltransferase [Parafilimonas terrae]
MNKRGLSVLLPVVAGLLAFISIGEINFYTGWIAFVPLFACVINAPSRRCFKAGLIFGAAFSCFAYSWMITGAQRFTGYNFLYGAGIMLLCALFVACYWGCLLFCLSLLQRRATGIKNILLNSLIAAAVFCLVELLLSFVSEGFPWFGFYAGNSLIDNVYSIQPASLFGVGILSFIVVAVNYLFAVFLIQKQWLRLTVPAAVIVVFLLGGYLVLHNFNTQVNKSNPVKIALINENILPDIKWDDTNGNQLVQRLLRLNEAATAQQPGIIAWTESSIPWTYRKDDDLVNEILKTSAAAKATQILGINTEVSDNVVNNSAYCIQPDGTVTGRYDKQYLLSLIEAPFININIPFFSSKGFTVNADSSHHLPLATSYGKAGMMICNESAGYKPAVHAVNNGAVFLCNISNDGWFNNTYIVRNHFYQARLRAVETRRDVAVNSNNGYSGFIDANGIIIEQKKDVEPFVLTNAVQLNNYKSFFVKYPWLFAAACAIFVSGVMLLTIFKKNN